MTEDFIEQYFKTAAIKVKDIGYTEDKPNYFRIKSRFDLMEFDTAVRSFRADIGLLLEMGSGTIGSWDSPVDDGRIGLHVLIKTDEKFENIKAARDSAKAVLIKIIALMRKDCEDLGLYSDTEQGPLKAINTIFNSEGKYDDIDGIDGNWYGKCIYFSWKTPVDLSYDPNNYND